ncbi:MAG: tetratricopeptide repeat protein, partial [Pirellulales bacterium]|nr:tetratricopeptide repeat protein [Pirellulales bacterium]
AEFLVGLALYEAGEPRAAREQFVRTRKLHPRTPEGLAANARDAALRLAEGLYPEALAALVRAVRAAGDPAQYSNPWLSLIQLQAQLLTTHDTLLAHKQFALAIELANSIEPVVSRDDAIEFLAHSHEAWAVELLKQVEGQPAEEADRLRSEAREQYRQAGSRFEELANLRSTAKTYIAHIWSSAESFLKADDYADAQRLLRRYLDEEARKLRPTALVNLGETLLAEDKPTEALAAFGECLEFFPHDAVAYRARLLASATHFELGELEAAAAFLHEVLNDDQLTPLSFEWREALFALGRLLHFEGRYDEAFVKLDEAVKRYPDSPQTIEARFLAAESYRLHAVKLRNSIDEQTPETQRQANLAEATRLYDESLVRHAALQDLLLDLLDHGQLTPAQQLLLRNSYFARGTILMALERWEEAIRTFTTFTNRYARQPEVLDAYLQIARCYRRMSQPNEARATLEQAKVALERMEPTTQFEESTSFSRTEWTDLLAWATTL